LRAVILQRHILPKLPIMNHLELFGTLVADICRQDRVPIF
jgi:hypothetical protein